MLWTENGGQTSVIMMPLKRRMLDRISPFFVEFPLPHDPPA